MSEYLEQFESFDEYEDKKLLVNKKSALYLLILNNKKYVVWENIDSVSMNKHNTWEYLDIIKSYYNVINGELILTIHELNDIKTNVNILVNPNDIQLILLSDELSMNDDESITVDKNKILQLTK